MSRNIYKPLSIINYMKNNDMLQQLFERQQVLQKRYNVQFPFDSLKQRQEFINLNILACINELNESLQETAWKNPEYILGGWKRGQVINIENFKNELIDVWHFVINLSLVSGMTAKELFNRFLFKNNENHGRQDRGY